MKVVGIDWSYTSPAITIINNGEIEGIICIKAKKRQDVLDSRIKLLEYPIYSTELERFDKLSSLILSHIPSDIQSAYIENYSYGPSVGLIFNLAESTGLFKYKFYKKFDAEVGILAPTEVKKYATGSGRAKKRQMVDKFMETEFDIYQSFCIENDNKEKIPKPIDDIVDSYWIAKYAYEQAST
jgi:Holliday junction resolvasome RuvABC endonuclease subunit